MPAEALRKVGRPPKIIDKFSRSINLKLSEMDYVNVLAKAENINITATAYARKMVLQGYVKAPFSAEELGLLRHMAGVTNNLNQFVRHLNSGEMNYKLQVADIIMTIKRLLDDSKKH